MLNPSFKLKTGEVSEKIERGRHTTRHVELLEFENGGYVADTPGFSSLDMDFIEIDEVERLFPEFNRYNGFCRFSQCRHISEPGCSIKKAVADNMINKRRYDSYVKLYNEINKLGRKSND
jgi:ribosome biogenesis GTPase